ncbi:MAG: hypothetical protein GTO08_05675, partial [Deltaproteobacteria bacterium]|nr:hypothetical protein [Deltaproteobacteria bacterium]
IETKTFKRVGGHTDIEVDVRIIAATNKDLEEAVKEGKFREDLFYRLNVIPVYIPPLRERREDIAHLAEHFLAEFSREFKMGEKKFAKGALSSMVTYDWPGNVRELKNVIERSLILESEDYVSVKEFSFSGTPSPVQTDGLGSDLPGLTVEITHPDTGDDHDGPEINIDETKRKKSSKTHRYRLPDDGVDLDDVELEFLKQALEKTGGNQTKAAKLLGLTRDALRYRMKKFEL